MSFNWLKQFHRETKKSSNYAQKTLEAYALGIKAGGSLAGVRIQVGDDCCQAAKDLNPEAVYLPEEAPLIPLPGCSYKHDCRCVYRPVMKYEGDPKPDSSTK
jgi:hypothetical protein